MRQHWRIVRTKSLTCRWRMTTSSSESFFIRGVAQLNACMHLKRVKICKPRDWPDATHDPHQQEEPEPRGQAGQNSKQSVDCQTYDQDLTTPPLVSQVSPRVAAYHHSWKIGKMTLTKIMHSFVFKSDRAVFYLQALISIHGVYCFCLLESQLCMLSDATTNNYFNWLICHLYFLKASCEC